MQDYINVDDDVASWITTESGSHIPLNEEGVAVGGAGGALNGQKFSKSSSGSSSSSKKQSTSGGTSASKGNPLSSNALSKAKASGDMHRFSEKDIRDGEKNAKNKANTLFGQLEMNEDYGEYGSKLGVKSSNPNKGTATFEAGRDTVIRTISNLCESNGMRCDKDYNGDYIISNRGGTYLYMKVNDTKGHGTKISLYTTTEWDDD